MNVISTWRTEDSTNDHSLESLIEYQNEKFNFLKEILLKRYEQKPKEHELCTIEIFKSNPIIKAAIIGVILQVNSKEHHKVLQIMDQTGILKLTVEKQTFDLKEYDSLLEGCHFLFYLNRKEETKKQEFYESPLKNSLNLEEDSGILESYSFADFCPISWNCKKDCKVMIISDVHCGSNLFLEQNFINLMYKINEDPKIKYLLINGDCVDGKDVYPGHYKEINLYTFQEQYERLSELLGILREDVTVIMIPGNHDMCRKVEPQFFSESIKKILSKYVKNIHFFSNPAHICIEGIYFYLNHGSSLNSVLSNLPWASSNKTVEVLEFLSRCRDMVPLKYGVPVTQTKELFHLIPENTNVICGGHMHNQGVFQRADGRVVIQTGAWQHLTNYMKLLGLKPHIAHGVCLNLKTKEFQNWDLQDQYTDTKTHKKSKV